MKFDVIDEELFRKFSSSHKYASFMQTVELGNLKKELGDIVHYVGAFKNNKLVAATLLLEEKSVLGKKTF